MSTTTVAPPDLAAPSLRQRLLSGSTLGPLAALLIACVFFSIRSDRFLTGGNFSLIIQQVMVVGTLAIGQTLIILTAGIDLSNGAIMAFGSIVMTRLAVHNGVPPLLAILLGMAVCTGFGLANGLLVTRVPLPPLFLLFAYLLSQTAWGKHVYAVGNNPEAARLTGIRTRRVLIGVYSTAGLVYGIAALLSVARTGVGDPQAGQTDNLDSITAVVLGGTSLFGGRGAVIGTLLGALIVGVIRNGLQLIGVASIYQTLITGILVILAVTVDQISRRRTR